jgi:hypothetical protein
MDWQRFSRKCAERLGAVLFRMLRQSEGELSKRAHKNEFDKLRPNEIAAIERVYAETFGAA